MAESKESRLRFFNVSGTAEESTAHTPSGGSAMAKAMTKSQVTGHLAEKIGVTKKAAGELLEHLTALAYKEAKNTFTLPGLGKLVLVNRKARMGRNRQPASPTRLRPNGSVKFGV